MAPPAIYRDRENAFNAGNRLPPPALAGRSRNLMPLCVRGLGLREAPPGLSAARGFRWGIPALEAAATEAADFAAKHEAAAASQKAPRSNVVLTQMRQGRRRRSSRPLQRRQSAMPLKVRLRSRRQTTGLQSSTRLLKRPGERPRVAKPQPSGRWHPTGAKSGWAELEGHLKPLVEASTSVQAKQSPPLPLFPP